MLKPACAADARASLQTSLLLTCKSASEEEAAVICSAFAAVKGEFKTRAPDFLNCINLSGQKLFS
jgi:hypothetical protein